MSSLISIILCSRMHLIKRDFLEGNFRTFFSRRMLAMQFQVTDAIKSVKASVE